MLKKFQIEQFYQPLEASLDVDDPVWKAWRIMKNFNVKQLPIVKDQKVIGIVSDRDIVQISGFNGGQSMPVKDAMSLDPLVVHLEETMEQVLRSMLKKDQQHAIVVDKNGRLMGLFSWSSALKFFLEFSELNKLNQLLSS